MKLPLFPLPVCLLPKGYTQLRIFEPRYKRLVSEALKSGNGFGLCMLDDNTQQLLAIGTQAQIINFETLDDGMLGISIVGIQHFRIGEINVDSDGLKHADIELLPLWPDSPLQTKDLKLKEMLMDILSSFPKHLQRYEKEDFENATWLSQRWLEILPINMSKKQICLNTKTHDATLQLLHNLIK